MAAANVLTSTAAAGTSSDFTVTATTVVAVKSASTLGTDCRISIQLKDDTGAYWEIGALTLACRAITLAPGVYRAVKAASGIAYGAFTG
jgi:hypothetical protein